MTKFKQSVVGVLSAVLAVSIASGAVAYAYNTENAVSGNYSKISRVDGAVDSNIEDYFDSNAVYKLPDTVASEDEVSVIVSMNADSVVDAYNQSGKRVTLSKYVTSSEAHAVASNVAYRRDKLISSLSKSGINYKLGSQYDTLLSGFEITVKAKDFDKVNDLLSGEATLIIGETYNPCETEVVTNDVDVYDTGIFDSSSSDYQGDGVVVAVLDTGLDYTHTAFSVSNFTTKEEKFTLRTIAADIGDTVAASYTSNLTAEDVYVNKKVPYAYDYADKDPDVLPINSSHGTHVAGVIAGKDDTITGVAPNAQLAIMKVFSDTQEGAKTSWIIAALEDCVTLGVDVINMSLGTACGFSREVDKENVNAIYDKIYDAGISLIASAANQYNATFGSEKNGSNGLTSNPDSGTVGSPSTYKAALSVASVDGVKTPYMLYNNDIIYFTEASTSAAKTKDFVEDILKTVGSDVTSYDFEYVTIPGVGRSSDYLESDYSGRIVLVKRGTTTFEEKVRVALKEKHASGIIIYNNVSGSISMSVGADIGAVCSISQDEGEKLAAAQTGILSISKSQVAGPFMSDFSSWGPTSDLKIKPEITAHGGEILSAIPGQQYDRMSGTSMAAPNQAGATALVRQYVTYSGVFGTSLNPSEITARVNQLMMSTADIIYNKNGLPYAVRKQGAGLVNIGKSTKSASFITTYDEDGAMDKTKIELGDDKNKTGVYEMTFDINNVSSKSVTYDIDSLLITEGVSPTYTGHGDTTVTQDGRLLDATTTVTAVSNGQQNGNSVTVSANGCAKVSVKIVLSDSDKEYLNNSFAHGMYVEGFITLKATSGTDVSLNVPLLAFYGDWTEAPIFDEEYYDTHADEINAGLDVEDKLMADAYATRVIGGLYSDYIATLGTYYFVQDPTATQIAASKEHIAISNQKDGNNSAINSIRSISAGLLRNAKEVEISIVEDSTGKEIFNKTEYNQHKSFSSGNTVYPSSIDVEFDALENELKNNTRYTVTVTAYIDYGSKEDQKNVRNTFVFPLFVDFEAPVVTDVTYRTEYDRSTKKTKLYADLSIYDNHYAMGLSFGQIVPAEAGSEYRFTMKSLSKYITPVYSSFNSTGKVTLELTDYVAALKESAGIKYGEDGSATTVYNNNSFIASVYDYAMNSATYEIKLPDEIIAMLFAEEEISLNPNETKQVSSILDIYPISSWVEVLDFKSDNAEVADVINQTIIAKTSGTANITAIGHDKNGNEISTTLRVKVLAEGDEGYFGGYSIPEVNKFAITGYKVNKAYYAVNSSEREIGVTDGYYSFGGTYTLSMFPSESVTLQHTLDSYFPDRASIRYSVGNSKVATVSEDGTVVAQAQGNTMVMLNVTFDGKNTLYSGRVNITVKDPYKTNSIYLVSYKGLGGTVEIPGDRGITTIQSYAFSNYEYVDKDLENGDVIDEEDPYYIKQMYIGEDTITKIVIPEGVEEIQSYAFAKLTALKEVVLPVSLKKIGVGAFLGCVNLEKINLENVKFINEKAFSECNLSSIDLNSVVAIGNYTFEKCKLNHIVLPASSQSLGKGAFYMNETLTNIEFKASKIKIGSYAFAGCNQLISVDINASVISSYAFADCTELYDVKLGKDVSVIGEFAFLNTKVANFKLDNRNTSLRLEENGALIFSDNELVLVAPEYSGGTLTIEAESIAAGAFAGNTKLFYVYANNAKSVGAYAFAYCTNLRRVYISAAEEIGDYAFFETSLSQSPDLSNVKYIGVGAFAYSTIPAVEIADGTTIDEYAFAYCNKLESVTIGNNVTVANYAFYSPINYSNLFETTGNMQNLTYYYTSYVYNSIGEDGSPETYTYYRYNVSEMTTSILRTVAVGTGVEIGDYAFCGNAGMTALTLGDGANIGKYAFYDCSALTSVDLSKALSIGDCAFSGYRTRDYWKTTEGWTYAYEYEFKDGKRQPVGYVYSNSAPSITAVDLSAADYLGEGAFAFNSALTTVIFGNNISKIPDYAFAFCQSISSINLPSNVTSIGDYAFANAAVSSVDLSNITEIGKSAFAYSELESIVLSQQGVSLGASAFSNCNKLAAVTNIEKVKNIGDNSFYGTALESVKLTDAVTIGDFAFGNSKLTKVELGSKLEELGENPFLGCNIKSFGKEQKVLIGGVEVATETVETFDVSATVKVVDGVLYQSVPNGSELVSFPIGKAVTDYTIEEGTVRVTDCAFAGSSIKNVTLPSTLLSIGDKAFYDCKNLSMVVFTSYEAPLLEEKYDSSYINYNNLPITGSISATQNNQAVLFEGLGIVKYYMWNVTSNSSNFYYGANFVDYIGHVSADMTMVCPVNGQGYDTFIFSQYFGAKVTGNAVATEDTLRVIELINALPDAMMITLANEAQVAEARAAYDALPSEEQKGLVDTSKLISAEGTIAYLKPNPPVEPQPETPEEINFWQKNFFIGYIIAGVAAIALVAYIVISKTLGKKRKDKVDSEDQE